MRVLPHPRSFRFGLSPSLGLHRTQQLARRIAADLAPAVDRTVEVAVAGSYEHLEAMLLSGALDAAWVNPLLLARLHAFGASASLQGVRHGLTTFRSALLARRGHAGALEAGARAAWTDPDSLAGYRLPIRHLRTIGLAPEQIFASERFTFSYPAALARLLDGTADVAPCFVHDDDPGALDGVLRLLVGSDADRIERLFVTEPVPNDGLVFAPHLPAAEAARLCGRVEQILGTGAGRAVLELLDVERVERTGRRLAEPLARLARA